MQKFAANLTMMFTEHDFLDRFAAAAEAGFKAVEFLFPYEHPAEEIAARLARCELSQALFNMPPGNWNAGERGLAALPGREAEFEAAARAALAYARTLRCPRLHAMAGIVAPDAERAAMRAVYVENLRKAARLLARENIELLIEPINPRDVPGYFLNDFDEAAAIIAEVNEPNLFLQFDVYHHQIVHGDLTHGLRRHMPIIRHIQIANPPDRAEPDDGEINYAHVFETLDQLGYAGWIGCEYRPRAGTVAGLGWFSRRGDARG